MVFSTSREALEAHNVVRSVQFPYAGPSLHHKPCPRKAKNDGRSSAPESPVRHRTDLSMGILTTLTKSSHPHPKQTLLSPPKIALINCVPASLQPAKHSLQSDWNNDVKNDIKGKAEETASNYAGSPRTFQPKRCSSSESSAAPYMSEKLHTSSDPRTCNGHRFQSCHHAAVQAGDSVQQSQINNKEASDERSKTNDDHSTLTNCGQFESKDLAPRGSTHRGDRAAPDPKKNDNLERSELNQVAVNCSSTSPPKLPRRHKRIHTHEKGSFKVENEVRKFCRVRPRFSLQSESRVSSEQAKVANTQKGGSDSTSDALRSLKRRKVASHSEREDSSGKNSVSDSASKVSKGTALAKLKPRISIAKKTNFAPAPLRRLRPQTKTSTHRARLASLRSATSHRSRLRQTPNQVGGGGIFSRSQFQSQTQVQHRDNIVADSPSVRKEKDQEAAETNLTQMKSPSRSKVATRRYSSSLERKSEPVTRRRSTRLAQKRQDDDVIVIDDSDEGETGPDNVKRTKEADDFDIATLGFESLTLENTKTLKELPPHSFLDPLSDEEETEVTKLYRQKEKKEIKFIPSARIVLRGEDFKRLRGVRWLNDEVINAYMSLINVRNDAIFRELNDEERKQIPRTFVFNTFFYTRLTSGPEGYDYAGVRRWTGRDKMDAIKQDLLLFPVNLGNHHWVLAAIDQPRRAFLYLDSMAGPDRSGVLPSLRQWYYDELKDKHGEKVAKDMDLETWPSACNRYMIRRVGVLPPNLEPRGCKPRLAGIPVQTDGGSCGVFITKIADCLALGLKIYFNQDDIPTVRRRMALDLLRGQLGL
ncbi:Ulp1 peptidase [Gracilaria domingensis]|nr:Ulp1 peptidase [Gracilaria domingensis]